MGTAFAGHPLKSKTQSTTSHVHNLKPFTKIAIDCNCNIEIIANTPLNDVRLVGRKGIISTAVVKQSREALSVKLSPSPSDERPLLIIRTGQIRELRLAGHGNAKIVDVQSPKLDVLSEISGLVDISGSNIGLESLHIDGKGMTQIRGVTTDQLKVKANSHHVVKLNTVRALERFDFSGNGTIELTPQQKQGTLRVTGSGQATAILTGKLNVLELTLHGTTIFDGRKLIVNTAFANTYHDAQAHLNVIKAQHALAADKSDILFYNNAAFIGRHAMASGAILNYGRIELQPNDNE